jgi:hypothetical protein
MSDESNNTISLNSFFTILDFAIINIEKIALTTLILSIIGFILIETKNKEFSFELTIEPPRDISRQQLAKLEALEPTFELDKDKILSILIENIKDKKIIKEKLLQYLPIESKYFPGNLSQVNYLKEIERISNNIKILEPVLDKELARIRNVSISENYKLIYNGLMPFDEVIYKIISDSLIEIETAVLVDLKDYQNSFLIKKRTRLNADLEDELFALKRVEKIFSESIKEISKDYEAKQEERIMFLEKHLRLAKLLGLKSYDLQPTDNRTEVNILDSKDANTRYYTSSDLYYKNGIDFINEEINFLKDNIKTVPYSEKELIIDNFRENKVKIETSIGFINKSLSDLEQFDSIFNNLDMFDSISPSLFEHYITYENNVKIIGELNLLKYAIYFLFILIASTMFVLILVSCINYYKEKN